MSGEESSAPEGGVREFDGDASTFEAHRRRCFAIAYRMLGSVAEADDVVQEAWLRWRRADGVREPAAWLTTTVTRLCLDHLGSARVRREQYVGPWLPELVDSTQDPLLAREDVSVAFLLLLERLSPAERAVFVLRKVFDLDHEEIARAMGKSESAVRQLASRAQAHVDAARPRFAPSKEDHARLLFGFLAAVQAGDVDAVASLLTDDVRAISDGGGKAKAARNVVEGRREVARLFVGIARKEAERALRPELRELNGWPALVVHDGGRVASVLTIETDGTSIFTLHVLVNPDKLATLGR